MIFTLVDQMDFLFQFETFYGKQFNGRKLTCLHHLSTSDVKLNYTKWTYFITMQTIQLSLLTHFEDQDQLTCKELQELSQLNDDAFTRYLQSLIDCKLLLASSKVRRRTVYAINLSFYNGDFINGLLMYRKWLLIQ